MFAPVVQRYKASGARRRTKQIATTLGFSRQYYYKLRKDFVCKQEEQIRIIELVKTQRKLLPRLGTRKLYYLIKDQLETANLKCGRDKLFYHLAQHDLLIKPKRRYTQTTNSKHWLRKHPNIAKRIVLTQPEQLWVTDITYIKTEEGNCYANLVTDAFSRKIVGYAIADNMETESMIQAYQMALKEKNDRTITTIHHSDRGLQYCSQEYIKLTKEHNGLTSMTENGDPYENALAERMNRTLKDEFGLGEKLKTKEQAYQLIKEAVYLYNHIRPHLSLNYQTPNSVHEKIPDKFIIHQGVNTYF